MSQRGNVGQRESRRAKAASLRAELLEILAGSMDPMTTTELRERLDSAHGERVNEDVYRNLKVLEGRGQVSRTRLSGRHVQWRVGSATEEVQP
ncbi:transcriptional repressor [Mycolicibacterium senegalense]|uniref:transcriptional repressor n=1 Tax=Mycobacteriaceae TaxID=1762 RepID=UPI003AACBDD5